MEIEVKAQIEDAEAFMQRLIDLGCSFSEPKTQDDMVWVENTGSLDIFLSNKVFLRIRVQNDAKIILTAKKSKSASGDGSLIKREHEVEVNSIDEARGILDMLGLKEAVRVKKVRRTAHFNDIEICIDEVEHLGTFVELERIGEANDAERIQKEITAFLETLGVAGSSRVTKGYDILMLEKGV